MARGEPALPRRRLPRRAPARARWPARSPPRQPRPGVLPRAPPTARAGTSQAFWKLRRWPSRDRFDPAPDVPAIYLRTLTTPLRPGALHRTRSFAWRRCFLTRTRERFVPAFRSRTVLRPSVRLPRTTRTFTRTALLLFTVTRMRRSRLVRRALTFRRSPPAIAGPPAVPLAPVKLGVLAAEQVFVALSASTMP